MNINEQSRQKFHMSREEKLRDTVTIHALYFEVFLRKQL